MVKRRHTVVVKARGHSAKHRHLVGGCAPGFLVALDLFGYVTQRVECAFAVELINGYKLGKVEHVDFFQLAGCAKFGCHHIQRHVNQRHDGGVTLADARSFNHDHVKARTLAGSNHVGQGLADFRAEVTGSQRAHEHFAATGPRRDGIHADAIAQQRATAFAPRWIDRNHCHAQRVVLIEPQAPD